MVRIEHYNEERIDDLHGDVSMQMFHEARNAVVRVCKLHGPTGPMGLFPFDLVAEDEDVLRAWKETADPAPVYFVNDDQYNAERYQYIECADIEHFTEDWIRDLLSALQTLPGWGIGISSIPGGYALLFEDRIMVTGSCLENAHDLSSFLECVHDALRNKDKYVNQRRSGICKGYSIKHDRLYCNVDYFSNEGGDELCIDRKDVERIWRNPFTGAEMLTLKNGLTMELPDDAAFAHINKWLDSSA